MYSFANGRARTLSWELALQSKGRHREQFRRYALPRVRDSTRLDFRPRNF